MRRRSFLKAALATPTAGVWPVRPAAAATPQTLAQTIAGSVIARDDALYDTWREAMIWQRAKAARRPDMLVQAETVDDVVRAVCHARDNGLRVTTRAGGHSMAACFLRDSGMLIDVSRLDGIVIDKGAARAMVGPGVICRGLAERLAIDGLAFPGAHCGTVPISGFLLGGGVGLNAPAWSHGASVFCIEALDIVCADGVLRHASVTENADLFWAARGGGPGLFGVVVRFYLRCSPMPGVIWGATYTFRMAEWDAVMTFMREVAPTMAIDVEVMANAGRPDAATAQLVAPDEQALFIDANAFVPDAATGKARLAPLTGHPLVARAIARIENRAGTYDRYYSDNEASFPQTYWMGDNVWVDDPAEAMEIVKRHWVRCPTPGSAPLLLYTGEQAMPDAAFSCKGRFYLACYFEWSDPQEEAACRTFSLGLFTDLKRLAKGSYINEMDQEGRAGDIATCFTPQAWAKLAALRRVWDPQGVFHDFFGRT